MGVLICGWELLLEGFREVEVEALSGAEDWVSGCGSAS